MSIAPTSEQIEEPVINNFNEYYTPPPADLPYDDGEPLESNRHRIAMNVLIRSLQQAYAGRNDFFCGGNMFIYYSSTQALNQDYKGPDFFAVLDVDGSNSRQSWKIWDEGGRYPDVIVELLSPSTASVDLGTKKELYERVFRTSDYYVFDPFNPDSLQGWHLNSRHYVELSRNERGWLWCESLGLWLGNWEGVVDKEPAIWLRFYDEQNNLVLLPEEAAQEQAQLAQEQSQLAERQAQQERERAQLAEQRAQDLEAMLNQYKQRFGEIPE